MQPNVGNTSSNQLNIGGWIYGNNGKIGIGVANPTSTAILEVGGQIKINGGSPGAGKVLMSDGTGLASWSTSLDGAYEVSCSEYSNSEHIYCVRITKLT